MLESPQKKNQYRSIFISDLHLGTRGCQAEKLLDFLRNNSSDKLYLLGDIVDGWRLQKRIYWPQSHSDVIREFLTVARNGNKVYYIVGNHDEFFRKWMSFDLRFGRIRIVNQQNYMTLQGKKYLLVHGDMFDNLMKRDLKWLMHVGDVAYNALIWLNLKLNKVRGILGMDYWSLSKYLKDQTKQAVKFITGFEERLVEYADKRGYDGVICGHIHHATIKKIQNLDYLNTGDFVESCTAVVETWQGEFKIIDWSKCHDKKDTLGD